MAFDSRNGGACGWRRTAPLQIRTRRAPAPGRRSQNHPLRRLPQRPAPHRQRLGYEPVSLHSRPRDRRHRRCSWAARSPDLRSATASASAGRPTPAATANGAARARKTSAPRTQGTCVHRHGGYAGRGPRQRPLRRVRFPPHSKAKTPLPCSAAASPSTTPSAPTG